MKSMNESKNKAAKICRTTKNTGRGAYNNSFIFSIRQQKELKPHWQNSSRSGNHGEKSWHLLPGRYIEASASFSNSGKGCWRVEYLHIDEELKETSEPLNQIPDWLRELLPENCLREVEIMPYC